MLFHRALPSFHLNLRNSIKKKQKYYFNDLGVRNALLKNFEPLGERRDKGALFENFIFNEMVKQNVYQRGFKDFFYYRNYEKAEIDFVLQKDGKLELFETKFSSDKKHIKTALGMANVVTYENCRDLIMKQYKLEANE